jgi:hypothetical protein
LPGASRRVTMLREYQNAVQQRIREGAQVPPKLSEYLQLKGRSSNLARRASLASGFSGAQSRAAGRHRPPFALPRRRS